MDYLSLGEYEERIAATRDRRMAWWREARFGLFVYHGLYSSLLDCHHPHAGVTVMELEFEEEPVFHRASHFPQLHAGRDFSRKGTAS